MLVAVNERAGPQLGLIQHILYLEIMRVRVREVFDVLDHEVVDKDVEGRVVGSGNIRKIRQLLDPDDRIEDIQIQGFCDEIRRQDREGQRQDVVDLTRQLGDDYSRRDSMSSCGENMNLGGCNFFFLIYLGGR